MSAPSTSSASSSRLGGGDDEDSCGIRCSNAATSSSSTVAAISTMAVGRRVSRCIGPTIRTDSVATVGTEHVRWLAEPTLDRPVLIAGFTGWNDAGDAASTAMTADGRVVGRRRPRRDRPRGLHRLRHRPTAGPPRRGPQPIDRVADRRRLVGVASGHRRDPRARSGARTALAAVLRADHRHRRALR